MTPVLFIESSSRPPLDDAALGQRSATSDPDMATDGDQPAIASDRFNELLSVVGPAGRAEFLDCLTTDLTETGAGICHAIAQADACAARHWGHALIGLAGTVGAMRLHDLARGLNQGLSEGRLSGARRLLPELRTEIDRLIRFCRHAAEPEQVS